MATIKKIQEKQSDGTVKTTYPVTIASAVMNLSDKYGQDVVANVLETLLDAVNGAGTNIASKLGSSTVGSSTAPIYLNGGTATACGSSLAVSITGNAATATTATSATSATSATKATQDGNGNVIANTYLPLNGGGTLSGGEISIQNDLRVSGAIYVNGGDGYGMGGHVSINADEDIKLSAQTGVTVEGYLKAEGNICRVEYDDEAGGTSMLVYANELDEKVWANSYPVFGVNDIWHSDGKYGSHLFLSYTYDRGTLYICTMAPDTRNNIMRFFYGSGSYTDSYIRLNIVE